MNLGQFLMLTSTPRKASHAITFTPYWSTGDINTRTEQCCNVINAAGTQKIVTNILSGGAFYSLAGAQLATYSLANSIDCRNIAVGDLTGSGYADCVVAAMGYYNSGTSRGQFIAVGPTGSVLQSFYITDFATAPLNTWDVEILGTDLYVATNIGVTKFIKSGSTWAEDTVNWNKAIGLTQNVFIGDAGNGTRIFVLTFVGTIYCYQPNGTLDWSYAASTNYSNHINIAKVDPSLTGKQIIITYQGGVAVVTKDGALSVRLTTGYNVRTGMAVFDNDGDGIAEIYYATYGDGNVQCYKNTGPNTYAQQYILTGLIASDSIIGLSHYDINEDGVDELFIFPPTGYCYVYDATLTTQIAAINIGHGSAGGLFTSNIAFQNGINFVDLNGDGHKDLVISSNTGYVDTYLVSGL